MIEISHLTKQYGKILAVDDLSFTVSKGEIVGFLGPNGAGKSTTMNIITGYIAGTSGTVKVCGFDIMEEPEEVKKRIGYVPEIPPLYTDMTVIDYLKFVAELKKTDKSTAATQIEDIMKLIKIEHVKGRLIRNLSKGYRQRVGLAQALIGNPEVLILDEPTVGLDPNQIIEIRKLISGLGEKHTVILSSHILPEVSAVCDRVIIINKGKIVAVDTPTHLSKIYSSSGQLQITVSGDADTISKTVMSIEGVNSIKLADKYNNSDNPEENRFTVEYNNNEDVKKEISLKLATGGFPITEMKDSEKTLEEIFVELTGGKASVSQPEQTKDNDDKEETK